jgi:hypothetical protein
MIHPRQVTPVFVFGRVPIEFPKSLSGMVFKPPHFLFMINESKRNEKIKRLRCFLFVS